MAPRGAKNPQINEPAAPELSCPVRRNGCGVSAAAEQTGPERWSVGPKRSQLPGALREHALDASYQPLNRRLYLIRRVVEARLEHVEGPYLA